MITNDDSGCCHYGERRLHFYDFDHLRYLNDFYELELQSVSGARGWSIPETKGTGPSPRESHTSVAYTGLGSPKLYLFGGMQGCRLDDLWQLDLGKTAFLDGTVQFRYLCLFLSSSDTMVWSMPETRGPMTLPRSLHSASVIGNK